MASYFIHKSGKVLTPLQLLHHHKKEKYAILLKSNDIA